MTAKEMDDGDNELAASVIGQAVAWVAKCRPDLTPQQHLHQASRLLRGMAKMCAEAEILGKGMR